MRRPLLGMLIFGNGCYAMSLFLANIYVITLLWQACVILAKDCIDAYYVANNSVKNLQDQNQAPS